MKDAEKARTNIVYKNTQLTSYPKIIPMQKKNSLLLAFIIIFINIYNNKEVDY